jgi:hypothetical protein
MSHSRRRVLFEAKHDSVVFRSDRITFSPGGTQGPYQRYDAVGRMFAKQRHRNLGWRGPAVQGEGSARSGGGQLFRSWTSTARHGDVDP